MSDEAIIIVVLMAALTLYALLGGADFGAGIWEFNTAFSATDRERALLYRAIGPVWEANHVWLIFILVGLQTAFPGAFAALSRALWLPLLLALGGIVFRGAAYAFRSSAEGAVRQQALWSTVFALASTAAPFFLGACVGAVASGSLAVTPRGEFTGDYLTGWLSPLAIFSAFFSVGVCSYLAAVYLVREASQERDEELVRIWRQRALATGAWMGILAIVGLVFMAIEAPHLWEGFQTRSWPLVVLSVAAGFLSLVALWWNRPAVAVLGTVATVAAVIWGWGIAQYPAIMPPAVTIQATKGPDAVLRAMVWSIGVGMVLLIPALAFLFFLFKGQARNLPRNPKGGP